MSARCCDLIQSIVLRFFLSHFPATSIRVQSKTLLAYYRYCNAIGIRRLQNWSFPDAHQQYEIRLSCITIEVVEINRYFTWSFVGLVRELDNWEYRSLPAVRSSIETGMQRPSLLQSLDERDAF